MNLKLFFGVLLVMAVLLVAPAMASTATAVGSVPSSMTLGDSGNIPPQTFIVGQNFFTGMNFYLDIASNVPYKIVATDEMSGSKPTRGFMNKWSGTAYSAPHLDHAFEVKSDQELWTDLTPVAGVIVTKNTVSGDARIYYPTIRQVVIPGDPVGQYRIVILYEIVAL